MRLPDGSEVRCTRDLVRVTGWAATALIAFKTGTYVARKRDCHLRYRQLIGDEWSDLLHQIYERCKTDWSYRLPDAPRDRQALCAICERTLEFENHFILQFKDFVLEELCGDDAEGSRDAAWLLEQIPFDDRDITEALAKAFAQHH